MAKQTDEEKSKEELLSLQNRIAELEAEKSERDRNAPRDERAYIDELTKIKERKDRALQAGGITYKDIHDHVNIPLYHTQGIHIGKVVGPIHPGNAEDIFMQFKKAGVILSLNKPTDEAIRKYKSTLEYKKLEDVFNKRRLQKLKSKKDSEIDRLTKLIAMQQGVKMEDVNAIKSQEELVSRR